VPEEATPQQQPESPLQKQFEWLSSAEGIWREDLSSFMQDKTPDLWNFFDLSKEPNPDKLREVVSSKLRELKPKVVEKATERTQDDVGETYVVMFNLSDTRDKRILTKRQKEILPFSEQTARRWKALIKRELETLILDEGFTPRAVLSSDGDSVIMPETSSNEPEPVIIEPAPAIVAPEPESQPESQAVEKTPGPEPTPEPPEKVSRLTTSKLVGIAAAGVAILGVVALVVSFIARPTDGSENQAQNPPPAQTGSQTNAPNSAAAGAGQQLVFDGLGGGSSVIRVYHGPSPSEQDKAATGTFFSGDKAPAVCRKHGRALSSDTSAGERARTSDEWFKIIGTPGQEQWATGVYVTDPDGLWAKLPDC
jgi:hypothetical protein